MHDGGADAMPHVDPQPRPGWLATPVIAPLLRDRRMSAVLALAGAAQVGLTLAHVRGMTCPFVAVTGLPCPGCGLSRGCAALCRGQWATAAQYHLFAPLFLLAIAAFAAAAVLPANAQVAMVVAVDRMERRCRPMFVLLSLLLLYWLARIGYAPGEVARVASPGY
jgi:hypothetical protein